MPTVADLIEALQQIDPETIVVLDEDAAQELDVEADYVAVSVILDGLQS
jgi:hypothetical protein